jgi:hypothetical protein
MAMNTANKNGTKRGPAIFSPDTTMTKAAATTKNRENGGVFSFIRQLQLIKIIF